jgi:hypothetical protein
MPLSARLSRSVPFRIRQTGHHAAALKADNKSASRQPASGSRYLRPNHDQQAVAFEQVTMPAIGRLPQRSRGKVAPNLLRGNPR